MSGTLASGLPLDPFGAGGGLVAVGRGISGTFSVADGGYQGVLNTPPQIYGRSDGIPGLISIDLDFGGATFVQRDTCFNQVTYTALADSQPYGTHELNANTVANGHGTQLILTQSLAVPIQGATLQALVDQGFLATAGQLRFFEFADGKIVGGFVADVQAGTYEGVIQGA